MDFVLQHIVNVGQLQAHDAFGHVDPADMAGLLDEAGRFFSEVVAPTNRTGDIQGSQRNPDGTVTTPDTAAVGSRSLSGSRCRKCSRRQIWGSRSALC